MVLKYTLPAVAGLFAFAGCTAGPVQADTTPKSCPVIDSMDWQAWVNKMPGPDGPTLHVTGQITLPTPGYEVTLTLGPLDRMAIPTQRIVLEANPPEGMAAQVLDVVDVTFTHPAQARRYGAVVIVCEDTLLAEISPIEDVH